MLEQEEDTGGGTGGGGITRKAAFRHEHVSVCDACQQAPAAYLCKADAASLCTTCDLNIHSANSLARRHHRVPILPVSGTLYSPPAHHHHHLFIGNSIDDMTEEEDSFLTQEIDEDEAASWLLQENNINININNVNYTNGMHFNEEVVDEYLDLVEYTSSCQENEQLLFIEKYKNNNHNQEKEDGFVYGLKNGFEGDGVVPAAAASFFNEGKEQMLFPQQSLNLGLQFGASSVSYPVSSSSCMDIVVVPQSTTSDTFNSHPTTPRGSIDFFSTSTMEMPRQLTPLDREARVLRYREKKKMRKFEKRIRYASRKAYAEIRPRVKGRFAKRTNVEVDVVHKMMSQVGYGIVPSF
uniref:Gentian CONSTANS-like homolog n=1 Tax=Gentiana triflora TaxID=55190 RepID=A0A0K2SF20_GENTR|nr:gentian CONSTANS-like homolog [Gentiana triflora]